MKKLLAIVLAMALMLSVGALGVTAAHLDDSHCSCCGTAVGGDTGNYHGSPNCCDYHPYCTPYCDPWRDPHPDNNPWIDPDAGADGTASWWHNVFNTLFGWVPQGTIDTIVDVVDFIITVINVVVDLFF